MPRHFAVVYFLLADFYCPVCASASPGLSRVTLSPSRWQVGNSDRTQPRKILSSRSVVMLVSNVYKCSHGHEVIGHDPGIINSISSLLVPFHLWHKTGVMKELVDDISLLIDAGVCITSIEDFLLKHRRAQYTRRYSLFKATIKDIEFPSFDDWSSYFASISPSWHVVSACFKLDFLQKEDMYTSHMHQITIAEDGCLSCDHTFASAGKQITSEWVFFRE